MSLEGLSAAITVASGSRVLIRENQTPAVSLSSLVHSFHLSTHQSGCAWGMGKELCQVTYSLGGVLHTISFPCVSSGWV